MPMKLFVVGESSPNPEDWSDWSEWSLVLAPDRETALQMAETHRSDLACEIPMNAPLHLCKMPSPNWGEDT